jgi:hypothetical protein
MDEWREEDLTDIRKKKRRKEGRTFEMKKGKDMKGRRRNKK